jgi:hypothetical protein
MASASASPQPITTQFSAYIRPTELTSKMIDHLYKLLFRYPTREKIGLAYQSGVLSEKQAMQLDIFCSIVGGAPQLTEEEEEEEEHIDELSILDKDYEDHQQFLEDQMEHLRIQSILASASASAPATVPAPAPATVPASAPAKAPAKSGKQAAPVATQAAAAIPVPVAAPAPAPTRSGR